MHLPMSMALAAMLAKAVMKAMKAMVAMEAKAATQAMVANYLAGMMATMSRTLKRELDLLAVAMVLMVVVTKVMDFHAMDLDLQQRVKLAMMLIHQRIGQPPNSVAVGLEQGHVQTVYCLPRRCL